MPKTCATSGTICNGPGARNASATGQNATAAAPSAIAHRSDSRVKVCDRRSRPIDDRCTSGLFHVRSGREITTGSMITGVAVVGGVEAGATTTDPDCDTGARGATGDTE